MAKVIASSEACVRLGFFSLCRLGGEIVHAKYDNDETQLDSVISAAMGQQERGARLDLRLRRAGEQFMR